MSLSWRKRLNCITASLIWIIFAISPCWAQSGISSQQALVIISTLRYDNFSQKLFWTIKPYIGTPYVWGGASFNRGMDCSAFSMFVMQDFGIKIPRTVKSQTRVGGHISPKNLKPGDLIFFDASKKRRGVDHVGVYLGRGRFAHSSSPKGVNIQSVRNYKHPILFGRRLSL